MKEITKELCELSVAHRLLNYDGKCNNLHGHNMSISLTVGYPDIECDENRPILVDFTEFKTLGRDIEDAMDHLVFLSFDDDLLEDDDDIPIYYVHGDPTVEIIGQTIMNLFVKEWLYDEDKVHGCEVSLELIFNNCAEYVLPRRYMKDCFMDAEVVTLSISETQKNSHSIEYKIR